jgi:hypothetical protein
MNINKKITKEDIFRAKEMFEKSIDQIKKTTDAGVKKEPEKAILRTGEKIYVKRKNSDYWNHGTVGPFVKVNSEIIERYIPGATNFCDTGFITARHVFKDGQVLQAPIHTPAGFIGHNIINAYISMNGEFFIGFYSQALNDDLFGKDSDLAFICIWDGDDKIELSTPISGYDTMFFRGHKVYKIGATTGYTEGFISGRNIDGKIRILDIDGKELSLPGDSGSAWISKDSKNLVGIHLSGNNEILFPDSEYSYCKPIEAYFLCRKLTLITKSDLEKSQSENKPLEGGDIVSNEITVVILKGSPEAVVAALVKVLEGGGGGGP